MCLQRRPRRRTAGACVGPEADQRGRSIGNFFFILLFSTFTFYLRFLHTPVVAPFSYFPLSLSPHTSCCFQCGQDLAFYASMDGCDHIMCGSCGEHCCAQMPLECPQCGKSFTTMKLWENSVSATEPLQTYPDPAEKGAEGMDARSIVEQLGLSQSGA